MVEMESRRGMRIELAGIGGHQWLDGSVLMMGSGRTVMMVGVVMVLDGAVPVVDVVVRFQRQRLRRIGSVGRFSCAEAGVGRMTQRGLGSEKSPSGSVARRN